MDTSKIQTVPVVAEVEVVNMTRALTLLVVFLTLASCTKREEAPYSSGRVVTFSTDYKVTFVGDSRYAEVRFDSLPDLHENFLREWSRNGRVKWEGRADCNKIADLYVASNQWSFANKAFHSFTPAQSLAMAPVWFKSPKRHHAVVEVHTDRGKVYIDPQLGPYPIVLTPEEEDGIYLRRF